MNTIFTTFLNLRDSLDSQLMDLIHLQITLGLCNIYARVIETINLGRVWKIHETVMIRRYPCICFDEVDAGGDF